MKSEISLPVIIITMMLLSACSAKDEEKTASAKSADEGYVVTMEDRNFTKGDLSFYTLMEKVKIEMNRHGDQTQDNYWDDQLAYLDNINVQLQKLIELYAMSLLAEEKNYDVPPQKLENEVAAFRNKISKIEEVNKLIQDYGETAFNREIDHYMRQSLLRDRVVNDLVEDLKKENPNMSDEEMNYELSKKYDDLYREQIADLKMEVHVK